MASPPLPKVELRELGNTGLKLSCVGFGASPLGNVFGPVSDDEAIGSVREAFRRGINFFDTSPYYGGTLSEKVLGKSLKALSVPRSEYIVATKCGRYADGFDFSADRVTKSIDESLERLLLDYVDILQCHDIEFGSLDQAACRAAAVYCKEREEYFKVEENVAAAVELATIGKDEKTLAEVEAILKLVKNQTWRSGIQQS
ncbi:hypothetical protein C1H46_002306 [Malus baccata]|uniref:NADP-dependent oxidoreductase domain-containing protein n=1 Tax=Malus baccata TaxID=106549 RepID=A0A540NN89_MALBA|nr:hypothetical protein C1H46_002306 [Malus baccata]